MMHHPMIRTHINSWCIDVLVLGLRELLKRMEVRAITFYFICTVDAAGSQMRSVLCTRRGSNFV